MNYLDLPAKYAIAVRPFRLTSPRAAGEWVTASSIASFRWPAGSANKLEYHLLLGRDLGYVETADYESAQQELLDLKRMLVALTRKVGSERKN